MQNFKIIIGLFTGYSSVVNAIHIEHYGLIKSGDAFSLLKEILSLPASISISLATIVGLCFLTLLTIGYLGKSMVRYVAAQRAICTSYRTTQPVSVKNELTQVRACLTRNDTKTAKKLLKYILDQGPIEQRQEARQLLEITLQMATLELQTMQNKQITQEKSAFQNTAVQAFTRLGTHLPATIFKDEAKLTALFSKFVAQELNTTTASQPNSEDYQVLDQTVRRQHTSRERKPTRYL